jgi:hypothetical protein
MRNPHASSRREILLTSGVLFAWTYLPKIARAEGRDPRLLVAPGESAAGAADANQGILRIEQSLGGAPSDTPVTIAEAKALLYGWKPTWARPLDGSH